LIFKYEQYFRKYDVNQKWICSINTSAKVLRYSDVGGQYANIRFDTTSNLNITDNPVFSIKIYVPSSGITGNQPNQISLKLQNGALSQPWSTQSEIIKPIVLNQWQVITFNFETDKGAVVMASNENTELNTIRSNSPAQIFDLFNDHKKYMLYSLNGKLTCNLLK
jgi:hypothetical protein